MSSFPACLTSQIKPLANRLKVRSLDFICYLESTRTGISEPVGPTLVIPTRERIDQYVDEITESLAHRAIGDDKPYNFGQVLREVLANGVVHPEKRGLPYRPTVQSYLSPHFIWATVTEENPNFDPHSADWQLVFDPLKLLETHGRSGLFLRWYADFSAWIRFVDQPWTNYLAVRLPDER